MCQMASEALLRASTVSVQTLPERFKASEAPSCSFLSGIKKTLRPGNCAGLRMCRRVIACNVASSSSSSKPVSCQAIVPLVKQEQDIDRTSCSRDHQSCSPDRWMEDCVCDIVRNINEAPFLHLLFDPKDRSASVMFQRRKVVESDNSSIEDKWKELKDGVSKAGPDGMILVYHLDDEAPAGCCLRDGSFPGCMKRSNAECKRIKECRKGSDLWGVLVLGKSIAMSACYILKTTSVASSFGTCTQFCLTKAKCFGPSWHEQVQTGWLLDTESTGQNN